MNARRQVLARTSAPPTGFWGFLPFGRLSGRAERTRPQKIAVFGLFGCGNLGNEGSLEAMLTFLRRARPDAELVCICDNPAEVARAHGVNAVPIAISRHLEGKVRRLDRMFLRLPGKFADLALTLRHLVGVDAIVVPGTGILDDFGERPWGMPLDIFRWCLGGRLMGASVALVSIGAGPIRHPLSRRLMLGAARLAHFRSYRDKPSKAFMQSTGFDTAADAIYPDIAFELPSGENPERPADRPKLTIGIGVMSYYGWFGFAEGGDRIFRTYLGKLAEFVISVLDDGHDVRLLTGEMGDRVAVSAITELLLKARPDAASRIAFEPSYSLHDLMRQIAQTDLVVATRFHNVVCALKLARPTISLGYSEKNSALLEEMGLGDYCQHVETFEVAELRRQFDRLVGERQAASERIRIVVEDYGRQLDQQDALLLTTVI